MDMLAPDGPVYQAGTLSGNPVAMAAGIATLSELSTPGFFEQLNATTERFVSGVLRAAEAGENARHQSRRNVRLIFRRTTGDHFR